MALPTPAFESPVELFAGPWGELECDPTPKPGVVAFQDFVIKHQGGVAGRIVGECVSRQSGHSSGRAWDWMISALDADSRARADELIAWLLANDAEMFRRAGLRYIIWNKQGWYRNGWKPYDGFNKLGECPNPPCRNTHTDHVHFSFGKPGAAGTTSFYDWLRGGAPVDPGPLPVFPTLPSLAGAPMWPLVAGFAVAFAGVMIAGEMRKR